MVDGTRNSVTPDPNQRGHSARILAFSSADHGRRRAFPVISCPCCGGTMHVIGEAVSEQLDVIPVVLQVKRIRRPRYGCRSCEGAFVQAKAPPR
jgi:transposase